MNRSKRLLGFGLALILGGSLAAAPRVSAQENSQDSAKRKVRTKTLPEYPTLAKQLNVAGKVKIEATIAAEHTNARTAESVHWDAIVHAYAELAILAPSPVVDLNRAVAVSFAHGAEAGLRILDAIDPALLESYHPAHVARADFLSRLGRRAEARESYLAALTLTQNAAERTFIEGKVAELDA